MPHETIGGRLRCGDRTIPHRPSAWIEERLLPSRLLRKLLAEGIRTKARSGPTPQSLPVRSRSRRNPPMVFDERRPSFDLGPFQSSLGETLPAFRWPLAIGFPTKWMLMLRLRNRSSFSAEELQSCWDNLQELEVKTQSRILRSKRLSIPAVGRRAFLLE